MRQTLALAFLFAALIALGGRGEPSFVGRAWAACDPGDKLDKTTADETRQKLQKAGYKNIRELRKGCDNTWHAKATKDGAEEAVAVLRDGTVVKEAE